MSSVGRWSCTICTFLNDAALDACSMCETVRVRDITIRVRAPHESFSVEVCPSTPLSLLRMLLESRCGVPADQQRLWTGTPRRELRGGDEEAIGGLLRLEAGQTLAAITLELRDHKAAVGGPSATATGAEAEESGGFIAWIEQDPSAAGFDPSALVAGLPSSAASASQPPLAPSPSPNASTTVCGDTHMRDTDGDDMAFGDDDEAMGDDGWGSDDIDADDAFLSADELDTAVVKAQQARDARADAEEAVLQSSAKNKRMGQYEILTPQQLVQLMRKQARDVEEALGCTLSEAVVLLRAYRWNADSLFSDYLADAAVVQKRCGLMRMTYRAAASSSSSSSATAAAAAGASSAALSSSSASSGECPICGEEMHARNSLDLGCVPSSSAPTHRLCHDCWRNWCDSKTDDGPSALGIKCYEQCGEVLPDDVCLFFCSGKKRRLLSQWILDDFVRHKPTLTACVNPACDRIIQYVHGGARDVECECGARFCHRCRHPEGHSPCDCELVAKWNEMNASDSQNRDWLLANTKPCPKCKTPIEKNAGCMHMTCKSCKHHFCWLCLGAWSTHNTETGGFYACNIYTAAAAKGDSAITSAEKEAEVARARTERYNFYWERHSEHNRSIQAALRSVCATEERAEQLQMLTNCDAASTQFLLGANATLVECRRALKWSYVIAFFLAPDSRQLRLFQNDQGQLERFSDELHELIELPPDQLLPVAVPIRSSTPPSTPSAGGVAPLPAAASPVSPSTAASSSSTPSSPHMPVPASSLQGDDLRRVIIAKTNVANKYLSRLVEAMATGLYSPDSEEAKKECKWKK